MFFSRSCLNQAETYTSTESRELRQAYPKRGSSVQFKFKVRVRGLILIANHWSKIQQANVLFQFGLKM